MPMVGYPTGTRQHNNARLAVIRGGSSSRLGEIAVASAPKERVLQGRCQIRVFTQPLSEAAGLHLAPMPHICARRSYGRAFRSVDVKVAVAHVESKKSHRAA